MADGPPASPALCVLLLPRALDDLILRDQAEDLLTAPGVVAVGPPRVPYGAALRLPEAAVGSFARRTARALRAGLNGTPRVVVIFHPVQLPVAAALCDMEPGCELWYARWDRYERAYDASEDRRARIEALHVAAAERASLVFAASGELQRLEEEAGRSAVLVPLAADRFPAPDPHATVVAASLGHLGWRTDWALLREVCELLPGLVLLLIGAWHEDEVGEDGDFRALRSSPQVVWLGARSDDEASALIRTADVGIVPFRREPFNDAGLPYRILKYARLGRRTVAPDLAGLRTWADAVDVADGPEQFAAALAAQAGRRTDPDDELRAWALAQTARRQDAPLWRALRAAGIDVG